MKKYKVFNNYPHYFNTFNEAEAYCKSIYPIFAGISRVKPRKNIVRIPKDAVNVLERDRHLITNFLTN